MRRHPSAVRRVRACASPRDRGTNSRRCRPNTACASRTCRLFAQQAQRHRPTFDPRGAIDDIAQIAHLTAGLPLALRIAAAWTRFLSCADVAAEIRRGLDALDTGSQQAPGIRATLMRTWERLTTAEKSALAQLSVFVSPFSAQAAREVALAPLPVLGGLIDRCLLAPTAPDDEDERTRFEMHPLVRRFAAEQLATSRAAQHETSDRHANHIARLLAPWIDFQRVDQKKARFFVAGRLAEILAAWHWSLNAGRPDFIARVARVLNAFFALQGRWDEAIELFAEAERHFDPDQRQELAALVEVSRARAGILRFAGRLVEAEAVARRSLAWARSIDHTLAIKALLNELGNGLADQGRRREAIEPLEEALSIAHGEGDQRLAAVIAANLGRAHSYLGNFGAAERLYRESLAGLRESGQWTVVLIVMNNLASLLRLSAQYEEAIALLEEGLRLCDEYGYASVRPALLVMLARMHDEAGRPDAALTLAERALEEARRGGTRQAETTAPADEGLPGIKTIGSQAGGALPARRLDRSAYGRRRPQRALCTPVLRGVVFQARARTGSSRGAAVGARPSDARCDFQTRIRAPAESRSAGRADDGGSEAAGAAF